MIYREISKQQSELRKTIIQYLGDIAEDFYPSDVLVESLGSFKPYDLTEIFSELEVEEDDIWKKAVIVF